MTTKRERDLLRLWANIEITGPPEWPSPCWIWKGPLGGRDFRPVIDWEGKKEYVARLMLLLVKGPPPVDLAEAYRRGKEQGVKNAMRRFVARHKCDNRVCPNPGHLEWGSHKQNMQDMKERERHGLSHYVVRNIKKLIAEGRVQEDIARLYGVSRETVSAIATGRVYGHVGQGDDPQCAQDKEISLIEDTK